MKMVVARTAVLLGMLGCTISAQSPPLVPTSDPGVARATLIDRPEIRVLRVEVQPGATRSIHTHTDVQYHLFSVISGNMQVTIGDDPPIDALPGKTIFFAAGTRHGFKNVGTTPAAAMEIFVRDSSAKPAVTSAR
jgi:quercetin dioxygenase-like cupin family protein